MAPAWAFRASRARTDVWRRAVDSQLSFPPAHFRARPDSRLARRLDYRSRGTRHPARPAIVRSSAADRHSQLEAGDAGSSTRGLRRVCSGQAIARVCRPVLPLRPLAGAFASAPGRRASDPARRRPGMRSSPRLTKRGYFDSRPEASGSGVFVNSRRPGELLLSRVELRRLQQAATAAGQGPSEPVRRSAGEWARPRAAQERPDARGRDSPYAWRNHSPDTPYPACA